ncbi:TetR/AcrR family transcriptional regulator [Ureibacillus aquaedulcis]|uniref:TetR/AcrR family transcriptional regulator n=1 Tax=Ureibacillus aquaedulcis TaxID=3058421 RepID=A0ABT8GSJ7_9BACL|nr:TetR/AcrR family transcriptional regulator [Ureibacillus sp. BA0131]MDN4494329.1 TetR/AcrR family transcriptional regulator [Ureibacillus sp. BA0131]
MRKGNRQMQAEKTRQRIFETALELFQKKGFDRVTVDEIVEKSKSSKGAFYGHFHSKYGIFLEKFKEIDTFYETFVQTIAEEDALKEKILKLFQGQMHYLEHELGKDLMRTVYSNGLNESENHFFNNTERSLYRILIHFVNSSIERGELVKEANAERIAVLITRCMRGNLYDWIAFGDHYSLQEESKQFVDIFMEGILMQFGSDGEEKDENGISS